MRKKVLCLVMTGAVIAGTMTVGTGTTVYAEDFTSQGDWSVTFNGDGMESSFSSQEMADEIYGILPGDSIELKVNVQNDSQEDTDWYMSNEVIKSLEEGSTAQGGEVMERDGGIFLCPVVVYPKDKIEKLAKFVKESSADADNQRSFESVEEMFQDMGIDIDNV